MFPFAVVEKAFRKTIEGNKGLPVPAGQAGGWPCEPPHRLGVSHTRELGASFFFVNKLSLRLLLGTRNDVAPGQIVDAALGFRVSVPVSPLSLRQPSIPGSARARCAWVVSEPFSLIKTLTHQVTL